MAIELNPKLLADMANANTVKFRQMRRARFSLMSQFVGRMYRKFRPSDREDRKASPLNLLYSAVTTLVPNLVFNDPRVKAKTDVLAYRPYADLLELALSRLTQRIGLRSELRLIIQDAIFMAGFIKVGMAVSGQYLSFNGVDIALGQPYAERVDPDDMILDPTARAWDEQNIVGNVGRYRVQELVAAGYNEADIKNLPRSYASMNQRVENVIGQTAEMLTGELEDFVDLAELYLPGQDTCVIMPVSDGQVMSKILKTTPYEGPNGHPFHMLGFTPVSDNLLPVAPAGIWFDLHILGNRIARKMSRQAERAKQVLAYEGPASEDVEQIADADDGETVRVDHLDAIKEIGMGGMTKESAEWLSTIKQLFSEQAGSLETLSGTSTEGVPTATQAQMLQANASVRLGDMQNTVYHFTADVARALAWYLHTDPLIELPLTKRVNGVETQVRFSPEEKQGEWLDYTISIQPYSMARPDPNMAVRRRLEFATNVIPAAAQAAQMLGPGFNVGAYLQRMALEVGIEDADEWLNTAEMQQFIMARLMAASMNPGKAGLGGSRGSGTPVGPTQPNQPVPSMRGPQGGISTGTEQAMAEQEVAASLQSTLEPSTRALALSR